MGAIKGSVSLSSFISNKHIPNLKALQKGRERERIDESMMIVTEVSGLEQQFEGVGEIIGGAVGHPRGGINGVWAHPRTPLFVPLCVLLLACFCLAALVFFEVDNFVSQTKTIAGHNLEPTPWHLFPPKSVKEESKYAQASKIIQCTYLSCQGSTSDDVPRQNQSQLSHQTGKCPELFRWIHQDLEPWDRSGISLTHMMEAKKYAAFRVVIIGGKLYVDFYYACVQSRAMFTVWGLLQLLRRYPGRVPDVDLMFDCMDKPSINREEHQSMPLPLFRYCTTSKHFDIPFPDWSFWGWPEVNIGPWDEEFSDIKKGSRSRSWRRKWPVAYWKGNPDVGAPIRTELLTCNHSRLWRAQIMRQDWESEIKGGFEKSKLSKQCDHR
ncbi:O-glucosyltransferase rumi-like protein [Actinidia rufa]|uniref:O-glucosyltransferase rumi-like protein n=1 Tax=Actinidia rufa TaxID=165716 RepID=A0A7J0H9K1_9ERIC|nr:O-glucosyltransferase rumi-like protein [Actinidia rufa]